MTAADDRVLSPVVDVLKLIAGATGNWTVEEVDEVLDRCFDDVDAPFVVGFEGVNGSLVPCLKNVSRPEDDEPKDEEPKVLGAKGY